MLLWLRGDSEQGQHIVFWLLCVIWATDTGAYFAGRAIGGPKLIPSISPNKTWAGLIGGMICAALVGWLIARIDATRSEEHTSELQSLMRISYAVFCLKQK